MKPQDIIAHRLLRHQIAETSFTQPEEIVSYYGAMQAQDWSMAKWALGLRLPHLKEKEVEAKFNSGKILRTHILRPTWHFVAPKDLCWIQKLTAPRVHQANKMYYTKHDITKDEVEIYVEHGVIKTVVAIRNRKQCSLREALDTLNSARNY